MAREVFDISLRTGQDPLELVRKMDFGKLFNSEEISIMIRKIMADQPHLADQSKNNPNVNNFVLGLIMKDTKGKVDPQVALKLIREILSKSE